MNEFDVRRLAMILAEQAEIEGMKSENTTRESHNHTLAYTDHDFCDKANILRQLAAISNDNLMVLISGK